MLENLLSFAVLAGLLTLLPGLDTAQILRAVTIGGRSTGYATLFGILGGVWVWGIAAALGISALLIASEMDWCNLFGLFRDQDVDGFSPYFSRDNPSAH